MFLFAFASYSNVSKMSREAAKKRRPCFSCFFSSFQEHCLESLSPGERDQCSNRGNQSSPPHQVLFSHLPLHSQLQVISILYFCFSRLFAFKFYFLLWNIILWYFLKCFIVIFRRSFVLIAFIIVCLIFSFITQSIRVIFTHFSVGLLISFNYSTYFSDFRCVLRSQ